MKKVKSKIFPSFLFTRDVLSKMSSVKKKFIDCREKVLWLSRLLLTIDSKKTSSNIQNNDEQNFSLFALRWGKFQDSSSDFCHSFTWEKTFSEMKMHYDLQLWRVAKTSIRPIPLMYSSVALLSSYFISIKGRIILLFCGTSGNFMSLNLD